MARYVCNFGSPRPELDCCRRRIWVDFQGPAGHCSLVEGEFSLDVCSSHILSSNIYQTFDSILYDRFRDRPGQIAIRMPRYIIQEDVSGRDIQRYDPFNLAVHPGRKVNMSMLFYSKKESENTCPTCRTVTLSLDTDVDITWYVAI
jgi:hypothetical protein